MNYIIDNCSLVNLANSNMLTLCVSNLPHAFYITPIVYNVECTTCKPEVDHLLANGHLILLNFVPSISEFSNLATNFSIDDGECESILACQTFNYAFVSDDNAARNCAEHILGLTNRTGSLGLIKQLVASGTIICSDAITAYNTMKRAGGFLPKINPAATLC